MNLTPADIDRIVAEVVRHLRALVATSSTPAPSQKTEATTSLNLNDKVITLASIKGKLEGVTIVIVPERAIVTPAVRDELRDRKIRCERTTKARS